MTLQITRRLEFDAGHTVTGHEAKCQHLHGHRYIAEITCEAPDLDSIGRVIDFSVIKQLVGGWLDENWDHKFLINEIDQRLTGLRMTDAKSLVVLPFNPTAENMATHIFRTASALLASNMITVTHVRLYETPNGWADKHINILLPNIM